MIGKFFHTPKGKQFHIPYRYYDPDKEEMQNREERIKRELGIHEKKEYGENYRPNIRGQFRRGMGDASKTAQDARRRSNTRLIMLIVILSLAVYLILNF